MTGRPFDTLVVWAQCVMATAADMSAGAYARCTGSVPRSSIIRYLVCVELRIVGLHTFAARSVANKKTANGGFFVCGFSVTLSEASYVVPKRGLEPLRLASLPPQGSASTSSATWAGVLISAAWPVSSLRAPVPHPCS